MDVNPYESPRVGEFEQRTARTGLALAIDSVTLLVVGAVTSVVVAPILISVIAALYGILQFLGVPLP